MAKSFIFPLIYMKCQEQRPSPEGLFIKIKGETSSCRSEGKREGKGREGEVEGERSSVLRTGI